MKKYAALFAAVLMFSWGICSFTDPLLAAEENGNVASEAENSSIATYAQDNVITPDMSQEQVDAIVAAQNDIVVEAGDYGVEGDTSHIQIMLTKGNQTVNLKGNYQRLMIVALSEGNVVIADDAVIDGEVSSIGNQFPALYIPIGSLEIRGNLTVDDSDYGAILGYTNATEQESAALTIAEGAQFTVQNGAATSYDYQNGIVLNGSPYFSYVDRQADGTRASGISMKGKGNVEITVSAQATLNCLNNDGAGIYSITVANFTMDMEPDSSVNLNGNGQGLCLNTDFSSSMNVNVDHASLTITGNSSNGITGQSKPYILDISNGSTVKVDDNGGIGINNMYIIVNDSNLSVSGNHSHGASNIALDASNSSLTFSDNAYLGVNVTKLNDGADQTLLENTTVTAENNGGPGIRFYHSGETMVKDSKIVTLNNGNGEETYGYKVKPGDSGYWASIVGTGDVIMENSVVFAEGAGAYSLYNNSTAAARMFVSSTDVIALSNSEPTADIFDDWNTKGNTGRTYVIGGSLQAEFDDVTMGSTLKENAQSMFNQLIPSVNSSSEKADVQYAGPVNTDGTALVRFDLHQSVNAVLNEEVNTFTYYDPNTGTKYDYAFRYNREGEDLDPTVSGNAYVWAPASVVRYDATEGSINELGTAGEIVYGSTQTAAIETGGRYAADVTIFGNSLQLAEKELPTAEKEGYAFLGWYVADDEDLAAEYAANGNFDALYSLLNTPFTETSDVVADAEDLTTGQAEKTVYAKWAKKHTITINYYDNQSGEKIADSSIYSGDAYYEGATYDVSDDAGKLLDGYTWLFNQGDAVSGTITGDIIINCYYEQNVEDEPQTPQDPGEEGGQSDDPKGNDTTDTGTESNSVIWSSLAMMGLMGAGALTFLARRRNN